MFTCIKRNSPNVPGQIHFTRVCKHLCQIFIVNFVENTVVEKASRQKRQRFFMHDVHLNTLCVYKIWKLGSLDVSQTFLCFNNNEI